ncbi:E3 ubiquitin-protein ligase RNF181 [Eutrema salsugineum]|uniref:E3 ubiquitin-protein ligase RNF181 n=1 Tax=Eutrema salsugineum TaxID=72664 RepID=UPI000CED17D9|nr:E3 ubiquitin-protein ligase RNF181 [Eutrema salsugineum]
MTSRLGSLRLYKFDVPYDSNVGVLLVTQEGGDTGYRFRLTRYTGRPQRDSKSGLSQSFVDLLGRFFFMDKKDSNITNQILTYLVSNFSFNDLEVVPPAYDVGDDRFVPIAPTTTEIVDCYRGQELCCLCGKGYPKEEEIVYKTVCNHIFHATCISSHLLRTPQCPVCSADLLPVDIRTLLF